VRSGKQIITTHAVLVVVLTDNDRFVLVQESKETCKGKWSIPGGMLEPGESIFEAGIREVSEEAGIAIAPLGLMKLEHIRYLTDVEQPIEKFRYFIIARHISGRLKDVADAESLCAKSFSLNEAAKLALRDPDALKWLEMACKGTSILPPDRYSFHTI
jgi:8-oxo-dGTP pyrophosphatase MutT (NUDIX family)